MSFLEVSVHGNAMTERDVQTGTNRETIRRIRARWVFSAAREPVAEGVVSIRGGRILEVARRADERGVEDLGNVAILPGFVNAHTHLEFSSLAEPLGEPGIRLPEWIRALIAWRNSEAGQRVENTAQGLEESVRLGTTTLGEIAQTGWPQAAFESVAMGAVVFLELIAPRPENLEAAMERARRHLQFRRSRWRCGLSPHAPYTVRRELLDDVIALSSVHRVPLAFHLAESREELELLQRGAGPLADFLRELESWDPGVVTPRTRPLDYLRRLAAADRVLVVHGNYLDDDEIELLAGNCDRMAVVYCPRTHNHFGHPCYPLPRMLAAGVSVALGTDSRASSPDLSMLAELRTVARKHPSVEPQTVLELATLRGARSLGLDREVGSLEPGKCADLAMVALPDRGAKDPYELLLDSDLPVVATWRRGEPVYHAPA